MSSERVIMDIPQPRFQSSDYPVVLFDSHCLICNRFVRLLIRKDSGRLLKFSGLHSDKALNEIHKRHIRMLAGESVVLLQKEDYFTESEAVVQILRILGSRFGAGLLRKIPRSWRDRIYRRIAQSRYRIFPKQKHCPLPSPADLNRFV